jgi:8-oxo-dGTP pyrophosphatase MutT (NUDIX family)
MAFHGAGVLVTFEDAGRYVLTGKESVYLTDTTPTVMLYGVDRSVKDLQQSASGVAVGQAKVEFENRAKRLTAALGKRVQYSQPVQRGTVWTTTYRILPADSKFGIPKGRIEAGEDTWTTAQRELAEETGIQINPRIPHAAVPVEGIDYEIFRIDITPSDAMGMLQAMQGRITRHYGELFDVGFRKPVDIRDMSNMVTRRSVAVLGGRRRKTYRRRQRSRSRASRRRA